MGKWDGRRVAVAWDDARKALIVVWNEKGATCTRASIWNGKDLVALTGPGVSTGGAIDGEDETLPEFVLPATHPVTGRALFSGSDGIPKMLSPEGTWIELDAYPQAVEVLTPGPDGLVAWHSYGTASWNGTTWKQRDPWVSMRIDDTDRPHLVSRDLAFEILAYRASDERWAPPKTTGRKPEGASHTLVVDPRSGRIFVSAGHDDGTPLRTTWEWSESEGWCELKTESAPLPRADGVGVVVGDELIITGGVLPQTLDYHPHPTPTRMTEHFDGRRWTAYPEFHAPSNVRLLETDPVTGAIFAVEDRGNDVVLWAYQGEGRWNEGITISVQKEDDSPEGREDPRFAFDAKRRRLLMLRPFEIDCLGTGIFAAELAPWLDTLTAPGAEGSTIPIRKHDALNAFLAPSAAPIPVDWGAVESWLGLRLPADYKALVSAYGPLDIGEHIWLHMPCAVAGLFEYHEWLTKNHKYCRAVARDAPARGKPAVFHPAAGGLLLWGETRQSSFLFWDTSASDNPDEWPVVSFSVSAADQNVVPWHNYEMPLLQMLSAAIHDGVPLAGDATLGPLPAMAQRTANLAHDAVPWVPPPPAPPKNGKAEARRRKALTEGSGLAAIKVLVPPPKERYLGDATWEKVFEALGTRLPAEYVTLMNTYGAGCWSEYLRFGPPLAIDHKLGLVCQVAEVLEGYRSLRADHPQYHPLPTWPEPGGFLPFADSIDGDYVGWLTQGAPDEWPVIVYPHSADQGPPLTGKLTDILLEWLRGRFSTDGLPELDEPLETIGFEPWTEKDDEDEES
ncbi:SMI1/KNR4 family protein [Pendulispora rubella]|uniref:SMI1/KNR4 family protein n=1 Tax=Pendulispora rubella TaxID=2741070 RepID=A0ABZ2KPG5_9BACT